MNIPPKTDILIVGAGPTGLAMAAELKRVGVDSLVLDRLAAGANTSRAAAIHARTLETLEPLGVTQHLLDAGLKIPKLVLRDRHHTLVELDFSTLPTAYPYMLDCPQNRTESILLARLEELGGGVTRPCEVSALASGENDGSEEAVRVTVRAEDRDMHVVARWVVGCDGMHSTVREQAGIPFAGETYVQDFILGDVRMDSPLPQDESSAFLTPEGLLGVFPLPEDHFRLVAVVDEAPEHPSLSFLQELLDKRGPASQRAHISEVAWSSRFRVHHRMAQRFWKGRTLLCGDAAHVHSPAGGQGMNTGIQDAVALAQPLTEALRAGRTDGLKAWEKRRMEIAEAVVTNTDRLTKLGTIASHPAQMLRNFALSLAGHIPALKAAAARQVAELDNR